MFDMMKKTMLAGIGLALKTKDEVEKLGKELIEKQKLSEKEGRKFLDDLLETYDNAREQWEKRVEKTVKHFLKKADIVTGEDLKKVKKEINELKKAIAKEAGTED